MSPHERHDPPAIDFKALVREGYERASYAYRGNEFDD